MWRVKFVRVKFSVCEIKNKAKYFKSSPENNFNAFYKSKWWCEVLRIPRNIESITQRKHSLLNFREISLVRTAKNKELRNKEVCFLIQDFGGKLAHTLFNYGTCVGTN